MVWRKRAIASLTTIEYERCLALMEPHHREKVLAIKNEHRRKATVLGEWLAKNLLSEQSNLPLEAIEIFRTEKGKPYTEGPLHFSITHSGDYVAAAVSETPIGIDMEKLRPTNPRLAERIGADPARFFEEWTAKEAHYKIYGNSNFKEISYNTLSPLHICEDGYLITIIKEK